MGVYPKDHKRAAKQHLDGCTCEKCYREFCEIHGMRYEKKSLPHEKIIDR